MGFETFSDTLRQKTIDRYILSCKSVLKSKEKYVTFLFHHLKKWFRKMIAAKKTSSDFCLHVIQSVHCFIMLLHDLKLETFTQHTTDLDQWRATCRWKHAGCSCPPQYSRTLGLSSRAGKEPLALTSSPVLFQFYE